MESSPGKGSVFTVHLPRVQKVVGHYTNNYVDYHGEDRVNTHTNEKKPRAQPSQVNYPSRR